MNFQELKRRNNPRSKKKTKEHYCNNCGRYGHIYRKCEEPITSYGIICYKVVDDKVYYILIRRRNSIGFTEFLSGRYRSTMKEYIEYLLTHMTREEQQLLLDKDFQSLWSDVWFHNLERRQKDYPRCKKLFDELKEGVKINDEIINLRDLITSNPSPYAEAEWGFPKGKRKMHEKNDACASREFCEETNFDPCDFKFLQDTPTYIEETRGSNNKDYRHIYYIAKCLNVNRPLVIDSTNLDQSGEIDAIEWLTAEECSEKFREYYPERKNIIQNVDEMLKNVLFR